MDNHKLDTSLFVLSLTVFVIRFIQIRPDRMGKVTIEDVLVSLLKLSFTVPSNLSLSSIPFSSSFVWSMVLLILPICPPKLNAKYKLASNE